MNAIRTQLLLLCLATMSISSYATYQRLEIGERMPAAIWKTIPKHSNTKLVILDFWGIYCGSCISAFPKMEALQHKFANKIDVVLVTTNTQEEIERVFKRPYMKGKLIPSLRSLVRDTVLSQLFPYFMVPQHVWLDSTGVVLAITSDYNTNEKSITSYLHGTMMPMKERRDLDMDRNRPLFTIRELPENQLQHYALVLKGNTSLPAGTMFRRKGQIVYGRCWYNVSLPTLIRTCAGELIAGYSDKQLLLEVKDTARLLHIDYKDDEWKDTSLYTLDVIVPVEQADSLYKEVIYALNKSSSYVISLEKRKQKCLKLVRTGTIDKLATKGGDIVLNIYSEKKPQLINGSLSYLVTALNQVPDIPVTVVDETGYKGMVDLRFAQGLTDLVSVRKMLQAYNLDLVEGEGEVERMVVRDRY